jgi:hypothetical protein
VNECKPLKVGRVGEVERTIGCKAEVRPGRYCYACRTKLVLAMGGGVKIS